MERRRTKGTCSFCNATFTKAAITKHLKSCNQRKKASEIASDQQKSKPRKTKIFHLVVEGRYQPMYWLHFEAQADATLEDLDNYLRGIWLECCGHLSAFTIQEKSYLRELIEEDGDEGMDVALGEVLQPGMKFYHEYDFGSTTDLTLKVVSTREGELRGNAIQMLARNEPPLILCNSCGKNASHVCTECLWSGEGGWLCEECAHEHKCGEEMLLPVVNSPRVGVCGYTG